MNKTSALKKKDSSALIFLEEAADFGCQISLSNSQFPRSLFLIESVDKLIKRLSHFKITPKSSSNCFRFCFLLVFCFFKITNQSKKSSILSQEQPCDRAPECRRPRCAQNTVSAAPVCPLLGRKVHSTHSLSVSPGTCTCR